MDAGMAAQGLSVVADPAGAGLGEAECAAHRLSGGLLLCGAEAEGSAKIAGRTGPGDTRYLSKARHSAGGTRSEEHTSELRSLMRISYAVFCLKKKTKTQQTQKNNTTKRNSSEQ